MIKVIDNVIPLDAVMFLHKNILKEGKFKYGEADTPDTPPTGMTFNLDSNQYDILKADLFRHFGELNNLKFSRAYVNLFMPHENPYFHRDDLYIENKLMTLLLYICPQYDLDEGGETQFIINDEIRGVFPKPGRAVLFDGSIIHRASSFRGNPRITIALKYFKNYV